MCQWAAYLQCDRNTTLNIEENGRPPSVQWKHHKGPNEHSKKNSRRFPSLQPCTLFPSKPLKKKSWKFPHLISHSIAISGLNMRMPALISPINFRPLYTQICAVQYTYTRLSAISMSREVSYSESKLSEFRGLGVSKSLTPLCESHTYTVLFPAGQVRDFPTKPSGNFPLSTIDQCAPRNWPRHK